jgi:hypothetical protein
LNVGGARSAKMIKGAALSVYKGAPHGLMSTHQQQLHADLLDFARQRPQEAGRLRQTEASRSEAAGPPA